MSKKKKGKGAFETFLKQAKELGFYIIKEQLIRRDEKRLGLEPPDTPRIEETSNQVVLAKELDGYQIRILTSNDPAKNEFTKAGRIWVLIVSLEEEKITGKGRRFQKYFLRRGDFLSKVIILMEFLWNRLENRPFDRGGDLMRLVEIKNPTKVPYKWKGRGFFEVQSFFENVPSKLEKFVSRWVRDSVYYEQVLRERRKVQYRARDKRKKWKKKKNEMTTSK